MSTSKSVISSASTSGGMRMFVMVQKELLELVRSFKMIWVPLVFIVLGIMQPVMNYYLPVIIEKAGNMPDGTVIEMPIPSGVEVLAATLQQFGTLGVLVLVLVFMGTVSSERNSGAASLILVKPISVLTFISSKWLAMLTLSWASLFLGYGASWYYTGLLFDKVPAAQFFSSFLVYGLWLSFIMALTLLFSTWLRSAAGAAFSTLGLAVVLSLFTGLFPKFLGWSPGALSSFAYEAAMQNISNTTGLGWSIAIALALIAASVAASVWLLRRSPAVD